MDTGEIPGGEGIVKIKNSQRAQLLEDIEDGKVPEGQEGSDNKLLIREDMLKNLKGNLAAKLKALRMVHEEDRKQLTVEDRRNPEIIMSFMKRHHEELMKLVQDHRSAQPRVQNHHPDLDGLDDNDPNHPHTDKPGHRLAA